MNGGFRITSSTTTSSAGSSGTTPRANVSSSAARSASTSPVSAVRLSRPSPSTTYATSAMARAGTVDHIMCTTCGISFDPATAGASTVVSEIGDILSPKKTPDSTAPAAIPSGTSKPWATVISATPIVPIAPHDEPVARETTTATSRATGRKACGVSTSSP
jgi:hypothetical protein